ncbi:hypothetical protein BD626DRAFT_517515 [Schizophyllum amplum]|uniref:Uncharacterized protein n=1 Tax=Schizophyllum amplum TaxID=97359 RepID=A0A550BW96_9AGAR|nr:hypothetical protein BD626DRAFT_517515 [Auriculariopsis ampla]
MDPETLFPELQLCSDMGPHAYVIFKTSSKVRRLLIATNPQGRLIEPAQEELRHLARYVARAAEAITAFHQVFRAIRRAILDNSSPVDAAITTICEQYDIFDQALDELLVLKDTTMGAIDELGRVVVQQLSYPPIIHFVIMHILGSDWSKRAIALATIPSLLDTVRSHVQSIAVLVIDLKTCSTVTHDRFSIEKLREIRGLSEETRTRIDCFVMTASGDLPKWADHVEGFASVLQDLAVPFFPIRD